MTSDPTALLTTVACVVLAGSLFGTLLSACRSALTRRSVGHIRKDGPTVVEFRKAKKKQRRAFFPRLRLPRVQKANVLAFGLVASAIALGLYFKSGPLPFTGSTLKGRVTHVRDGDTIVVNGTPIRFTKLDCAELGTAQGAVAKRRMFQLASGRQVTCRLHGRKSYDREIGECMLADGRDLSIVMIREGVCGRWW